MRQINPSIENKWFGASRPGARMLENKCAVVFGAGGSIGAAVAKEFAAEGARVFLAGRTKASLEAVAERITAAGGEAQTTVVDALDDTGVNRYLDDVAKHAGKIGAYGASNSLSRLSARAFTAPERAKPERRLSADTASTVSHCPARMALAA